MHEHAAHTQVDEMEKAVDVAEKNMARFGLTQAEISNRRKWVMQTRKKVTGATYQWKRNNSL